MAEAQVQLSGGDANNSCCDQPIRSTGTASHAAEMMANLDEIQNGIQVARVINPAMVKFDA